MSIAFCFVEAIALVSHRSSSTPIYQYHFMHAGHVRRCSAGSLESTLSDQVQHRPSLAKNDKQKCKHIEQKIIK